jgi:hypothetical protein
MVETLPLAAMLVREIFGIPLDFLLMGIGMGAMLGLIIWGSRPSVMAKYGTRRDDGPAEDASAPPHPEDSQTS